MGGILRLAPASSRSNAKPQGKLLSTVPPAEDSAAEAADDRDERRSPHPPQLTGGRYGRLLRRHARNVVAGARDGISRDARRFGHSLDASRSIAESDARPWVGCYRARPHVDQVHTGIIGLVHCCRALHRSHLHCTFSTGEYNDSYRHRPP